MIEMFVRLDGSLHSRDTHSVECHYMRTMLILFLGHHFHLNCNYPHMMTSVIMRMSMILFLGHHFHLTHNYHPP